MSAMINNHNGAAEGPSRHHPLRFGGLQHSDSMDLEDSCRELVVVHQRPMRWGPDALKDNRNNKVGWSDHGLTGWGDTVTVRFIYDQTALGIWVAKGQGVLCHVRRLFVGGLFVFLVYDERSLTSNCH